MEKIVAGQVYQARYFSGATATCTILRAKDGRALLISPAPPTESFRADLKAHKCRVVAVIASLMHDEAAAMWAKADSNIVVLGAAIMETGVFAGNITHQVHSEQGLALLREFGIVETVASSDFARFEDNSFVVQANGKNIVILQCAYGNVGFRNFSSLFSIFCWLYMIGGWSSMRAFRNYMLGFIRDLKAAENSVKRMLAGADIVLFQHGGACFDVSHVHKNLFPFTRTVFELPRPYPCPCESEWSGSSSQKKQA